MSRYASEVVVVGERVVLADSRYADQVETRPFER